MSQLEGNLEYLVGFFQQIDPKIIMKILKESNDDFEKAFTELQNIQQSLEEKNETKPPKNSDEKMSQEISDIDFLKSFDPSIDPKIIEKILKESNNFDDAFQKILDNHSSLEENIKSGLIPTKAKNNFNQTNQNKNKSVINISDSQYSQNSLPSSYYFEEEEEEEEEEEYESQQKNNISSFEKIDLHGYNQKEAREIVENVIKKAKKKKIGVFHFITGQGNHSIDGTPVLRPLVLEICKKYNVHAYISSKIQGVVVCNVSKKYQD